MKYEMWEGFETGRWCDTVDVRDFIHKNYTPYEGDDRFLAEPTDKTKKVYAIIKDLIIKEIKEGVIDVETKKVSGIDRFEAGYILSLIHIQMCIRDSRRNAPGTSLDG